MLSAILLAVPLAAGCGGYGGPLPKPSALPVREVTVFKDGHAFVLHQGPARPDADGRVVLDHLPVPVLGTFWPYAAGKDAKLVSVTAGRRTVAVERTALTVRELLEANPGAEVVVTEQTGPAYPAKVVGFPERSPAELRATSPPGAEDALPQKGDVVLLETAEGTKAVPLAHVRDVKFKGKYRTKVTVQEQRNLLALKLDGPAAGRDAEVGMVYLQKGLRWIPNYRVELDGKGKAEVRLQATLVNDLTDLTGATVNLVVGVPSFAFKDSTDPVALGQTVSHLSPYFQPAARTGHALSNAIMTQQLFNAAGDDVAARPAAGPDVPDGGKHEDLYIFTLKNVTLRKGERMVLPVTSAAVPYKDAFVLEVPFAPPPELRRHHGPGDGRDAELARQLARAKVMHKVRLTNTAAEPLTTAPAVILRGGRLIAQGMMTYAPRGGTTDLTLTAAVDVAVKKEEREVKRTPDAVRWNGTSFTRIDLAGSLTLTSRRDGPVEVEVVRHLLGRSDEAGKGGSAEMLNLLEDDAGFPADRPDWWGWYSWPGWWASLNGVGRVKWAVTLEPGKPVELTYAWHYFWN